MANTFGSVCKAAEENLNQSENFEGAYDVRELGLKFDPRNRKPLDDTQVEILNKFITEVVVRVARA